MGYVPAGPATAEWRMPVTDRIADLDGVVKLPLAERLEPLVHLGRRLLDEGANGATGTLVPLLVEAVESGLGDGATRVELGEILGMLGDPRLHTPDESAYWVEVPAGSSTIRVGRFPVTNAEFAAFVESGGYEDRSLWNDEGWAWLQENGAPWPVQAQREEARPLVVANQPVVGITLFEAEAYANRYKARLPRADERVSVVRGAEKRPYPWGAPFGEGNANTREEVLARPCAVGLFVRDQTPEGVRDLAGNVAEWTADRVGDEYLIHPGAWDQPSMAAWAKALTMASPSSRWAGLGFRLVD